MTTKQRIAALERIIVDAVSGMDPSEDLLAEVKVHYANGHTGWLVDVIKTLAELRAGLGK